MRIVLVIAYAVLGAGFVERAIHYRVPWSWLAATAAILLLVVAYGTARKTWWGVNPASVPCPRCGTTMDVWGGPRTFKRLMFGGRVCPHCGCATDQWGCEPAGNGNPTPTAR